MLAQPEAELFAGLRAALASSWRLQARPDQLAPSGDWSVWLVMGGRGSGKTHTGAAWVLEQVMSGAARRVALVAPTAADARDTMVEGQSGILSIAPNHARPEYEPSKRRLTWPNGAIATTFSADEPERLRGPNHDAAWADELGAWRYAGAWDQLQLGLRMGAAPRCVVTTTPKPLRLLRDLLNREGRGVVVTRCRTRDNLANLAPGFVEAMEARYGGTRLGRQELDGEYLEDIPGALWTREMIDAGRVERAPELKRIVVAVDPSVSTSENADECGIIVAGIGRDGHIYVLDDMTARLGPLEWAQRAVSAYHKHDADRIVAEVNNGGDLVRVTVQTVEPSVPFKAVRASRGKTTRAEPVSSLYEQGKVHHVGSFPELEDQCCAFTADFNRASAGYSPDRVDALVWAVTELGVIRQAPVAATGFYTIGGSRPAPIPDPEWYQKGWKYAPNDILWMVEIKSGRVSREEAIRQGYLTEARATELKL